MDFDAHVAGLIWILIGAAVVILGWGDPTSARFGFAAVVASQVWFAAGYVVSRIKEAKNEVQHSVGDFERADSEQD